MRFEHSQIFDLSQQFWASTLGLQVQNAEETASTNGEPMLSSCVQVKGGFEGAIVVECPESIGRHAAAMLYAVDGETDRSDVEDAVTDLAKMLGEKLQPIFPEESQISKPQFVDDERKFEELNKLGQVQLSCEGRPVRVALFEKQVAPAG